MNYYGGYVNRLIDEFAKLPGIGAKSAARLAFYVIHQPPERANALAAAISEAKNNIRFCSVCCNLTDSDPCFVCAGAKRDHGTILVVETPQDMAAYEKTGEYHGAYHVLHGAISPMNGVSPKDLRIKELLARLNEENINELIFATNPTAEGEATAMYLGRLIKPLGIPVKITRIAHGVPVGADIEYVDSVTLGKALFFRREF
ncbi:recombination protein RecR [Clostridia bacterium]|nr:recombination protein RecR [Clostridia bacterium]GHU75436.1 recombination protein RecR [Clostridia bacterium]